MRRRLGRDHVLPALTLAAVLGACVDDRPPPPDVIARIADREIPYAEFEGFLRRSSLDIEEALGSDVLSGLFDQFIEEELLYRTGLDRGVIEEADDVSRSVRKLLDAARLDEITATEIEAYYQDNIGDFERAERVRLSQILVRDRAMAETARAELAAGEAFEEVARRVSQEPAAVRGGDQGELARADLPPAFAEVIFSLGAGEVSEIVAADYGFHIFEVTARLAAERLTLAEARPAIVEKLRRSTADRTLDKLVEEARGRYNVQVFERNLPFNYEGAYGSKKKSPHD